MILPIITLLVGVAVVGVSFLFWIVMILKRKMRYIMKAQKS